LAPAVAHAQRREARELHLVRELLERVLGREPLEGNVLLAHQPLELLPAVLERVLAPLAAEPLPDLVAGAWRLDPSEPVLRRSLTPRLGGQDVDRVAGPQLVVE